MLRFYDSIQKRDYDRFDGTELLLVPRTRFVPFEIVRTHVASDYVQTISLIDTAGSETDISAYFDFTLDLLSGTPAWTNGTGGNAYDTLTATGDNITSAILSPANPATAWVYSNTFYPVGAGDLFYVIATLTLNAGTAPDVYLGPQTEGSTLKSNVVTLSAGANKFILRASEAGTFRLYFKTDIGDTTNYSCTVSIQRTTRPFSYEKTSKDYLLYKGHPLDTRLPMGTYCLKIVDNKGIYYSDWFCIKDLLTNIVTGWTNDGTNPYDTFSYTASSRLILAVETTGGGMGTIPGQANSSTFTVAQDEVIGISGCLAMISGIVPEIALYDSADDSVIDYTTQREGANIIELTSDRNCTAYIKIYVRSQSNFSILPITVYRQRGSYIRILWNNSKDLRDIAGKFDFDYSETMGDIYSCPWDMSQEIFLNTVLNTPVHETSEVGEEKDGVFIAEKITATPRQRIVAYITRSTYEGLLSLPLHDTITIWDEVGNKYLVGGAALRAAGNIEVNFDFTTFEVGTLEILFTESSYYETENIDNIT